MDMFTAKQHDGHSTDIAMLRGARMVTASETEEGRSWAEARIKQMTGGDPITARFIRQDNFTFTPAFKLALIGNHNPRLKNLDDAVRRRFNLVPFLNKVEKQDQDRQLEQKLRGEGAGIMQWLVDGCLAWQSGGLAQPAAVREATEKYFSAQDLIGQWLVEFYVDDLSATTANGELFKSWMLYAQATGSEPGTQRALIEALERRGYELTRTNTKGRCMRGLRPATPTDKSGFKVV
jgi:putative DNA primase/helicase